MEVVFGAVDHIDKQDRPVHETYESRLKLAEMYDAAGFYAFHLTEHHCTPLGLTPSPGIFLAAAAQRTKTLRFAPLVYTLPFYEPVRLANEICMLDHLSKGRFEFGVGRGISPYELAYFNINHLEAPEIYREAYDVLMMGLTEGKVDYRGRYFTYRRLPMDLRPLQQPHPPMWYAPGGPEAAVWAAENNMSIVSNRPGPVARAILDAYKEAWNKKHGGSGKTMPKLGITRHVYVGETDEEATERGGFGFAGWYNSFGYLWRQFDPRPENPNATAFQYERACLFGSAATVREKIAEQIEETGANYYICRFAYGDLSHEESARSFERFASDVLPHFKK